MNSIKQLVRRQEFHPGLLGMLINPYYFARKGLRDEIRFFARRISGNVLDVGCGYKPYEAFFNCSKYVGVEIDSPKSRLNAKVDYLYDGKKLPFADKEFDAVISTQVFEHVFNPEVWLNELKRALKPGGLFLITIPFAWDEHEQPYDFARYSSFGITHILKQNNFEIVEHHKITHDIRAQLQLLNVYIFKKLVVKKPVIRSLMCLFLIAPLNVLGTLLWRLLPGDEDFYLDNILLAKLKTND